MNYGYSFNPCWSPKTGDCKDRKIACATTCERWKEYEKKRQEVRDIRRKFLKEEHEDLNRMWVRSERAGLHKK